MCRSLLRLLQLAGEFCSPLERRSRAYSAKKIKGLFSKDNGVATKVDASALSEADGDAVDMLDDVADPSGKLDVQNKDQN